MIEEAQIATVVVNLMPAYQRITGAPRVVAVSHPFGRPFGDVGDSARQRAVLGAALRALEEISTPGTVVHLPCEWHEEPKATKWAPDAPAPIIAMLFKNRG